jgi:hypothetical protein
MDVVTIDTRLSHPRSARLRRREGHGPTSFTGGWFLCPSHSTLALEQTTQNGAQRKILPPTNDTTLARRA